MCIFSKPVIDVSDTKIFARRDGDMQYLAYQMNFEASMELAMILPIPFNQSIENKDDAIQFVDFSKHADFFGYLHGLCTEQSRGLTKGTYSMETLKVHKVGEFEATFIPTLSDFSRLDERFKLSPEIWDNLPQYKDYGFVVFKLQPEATTVHPMVFKFPMADTTRLFFPTVHIHDGEVHKLEHFNHVLYMQPDKKYLDPSKHGVPWWMGSYARKDYDGVLQLDVLVFKRKLTGTQRNEDQWLQL